MRKNKLKKYRYCFCMMLISFITFVSFFKQSGKAKAIAFDDWYSDSYEVGYWANNPKVFYVQLSSFGVMSYLEKAVNKWKNAGISSSITTTTSDASIKFYSGSKAELNGIGFVYNSSIIGLTLVDSATVVSNVGSPHKVKKFSAVSSSVSKEAKYHENVTLHEYGHVLGWIGHSTESADVMQKAQQSKTTLTTRDKKQLKQVYNEMR